VRPTSALALACALACTLASASTAAQAFEVRSTQPDFTIRVPQLPAIALAPPSPAPAGAARTLAGQDATYAVELMLTTADAASTRTCAATFIRALVGRPGMPNRDHIYRAPLDVDTFLVLYIHGEPARLHAHILSAAAGTHCIELHVSRARRAGEDDDAWRRSFAGSHVRAAPR
jgi:hypothetical protein